jgi:hypothetical protein
MGFGTLTLADLQATLNASTITQVGEDITWQAIQETLAIHNAQMGEIYGDFALPTTDETDRYGGTDTMVMEDMDELAVPRAQKVTAGQTVGFPLNAAGAALQWSEMWFRKHTLGELAAQVDAMMDADRNRVIRDMKRALFYSSNYTHTDHLARGVDIPVKRLVNADSAPIPPGPNGEAFTASTHTHYIARVSTFAATDLDAAINTVKEHYATGEILVLINQAQEAAVRAFTGFVAYLDARLVGANNATQPAAGAPTLDPVNFYNRAIGLYNGAEIWVKPWIPANYLFAYNAMAPKSLRYRYDPAYGDGLQLIFDNPDYPLRSRGYRRIFGVGVWNRINGAVLYVGGTSYANPTLT